MNPEQKVKWLILQVAARFNKTDAPEYPCENVDQLYDSLVENDEHWDAKSEVRCSGIETGLECDYSGYYESSAVAMQMPDGTWVGWTYFYGGGKHSEPSAIEWIEYAYDLTCTEEEKVVVVRTFSK
jgi:hypothetical protein